MEKHRVINDFRQEFDEILAEFVNDEDLESKTNCDGSDLKNSSFEEHKQNKC